MRLELLALLLMTGCSDVEGVASLPDVTPTLAPDATATPVPTPTQRPMDEPPITSECPGEPVLIPLCIQLEHTPGGGGCDASKR